MGQVSWQAAPDGRYWIDLAVGNQELCLMVDLGLTDRRHLVGAEVDPAVYHQLQIAGQFSQTQQRRWRDATGRSAHTECGLTAVQLIDPVTRRRVGPVVQLYVNRGFVGVPSRVGVVFFHALTGCRVIWALDTRTWVVEYP
jgi:hypothetical protein